MDALSRALELAPIVERVHGASHPELTRVRELTVQIARSEDDSATAGLFRELRKVTDDYTVPGGACEALASTYRSLRSADQELVSDHLMRLATPFREGAVLMTKRMTATGGTALPRHEASQESVLVILDGRCTITFADAVHELRAGDTFVVPADEVHQIVAKPDFTAVHVMPRDIRFHVAG